MTKIGILGSALTALTMLACGAQQFASDVDEAESAVRNGATNSTGPKSPQACYTEALQAYPNYETELEAALRAYSSHVEEYRDDFVAQVPEDSKEVAARSIDFVGDLAEGCVSPRDFSGSSCVLEAINEEVSKGGWFADYVGTMTEEEASYLYDGVFILQDALRSDIQNLTKEINGTFKACVSTCNDSHGAACEWNPAKNAGASCGVLAPKKKTVQVGFVVSNVSCGCIGQTNQMPLLERARQLQEGALLSPSCNN